MPTLEQVAYNATPKWTTRTVTATFARPTKPGSLLVAVCSAAGTLPSDLTTPPGFTLLDHRGLRDIQQTVWYRVNAPSTISVSTTTIHAEKSMQLRVFEYSGVAQANALDKISARSGEDRNPYSGSTGVTSQDDSLVLAFVTNQYASTTQSAFTGGLTLLYDTVSPQSSSAPQQDWERSRLTVHERITNTATSHSIGATLSTTRRWLATIVVFKGGSLGPALLSATTNTAPVETGGGGVLDQFGPLAAGVDPAPTYTSVVSGDGLRARIGPFDHQYLLGGWEGLRIGVGTPWRVEEIEGLEGWELRTSDIELPRGDGAVRGIDLQSARIIRVRVNTYGDHPGDPAAVEAALDELYRALVPQRDADWEFIWRHPGRPLRMVRVRPTNLVRELDARQVLLTTQEFVLRAADPRHYSAIERRAIIPNTPAGGVEIPTVVVNEGNGWAYPIIRVDGPPSGVVTRVEVRNITIDSSFVVEAALPAGSTLIGDMDARATDAPRSVVTIDGASKYGAWAHPREAFKLAPGGNEIVLTTEPAGAPVTAVLTYRDTWSG